MKVAKEVLGRKCPKCGKSTNQVNAGKDVSGRQRCICNDCRYKYTLNPANRTYTEEQRQQAIKVYYSGVSGRGVGKIFGMSKANVYNWIKKNGSSVDKSDD